MVRKAVQERTARVAIKPTRGQWLVSRRFRRVYGRVLTVRRDGRVRYVSGIMPSGVVMVSTLTWEQLQYAQGTYRFVDAVPAGYDQRGCRMQDLVAVPLANEEVE